MKDYKFVANTRENYGGQALLPLNLNPKLERKTDSDREREQENTTWVPCSYETSPP